MKLRIPIDTLSVGMFVEANVLSVMVGNEIRHFLELSDVALEELGKRRLRIKRRRVGEVADMGGMLLQSEKQLSALKDIGVSEVTIDTEKSEVVPDVEELHQERSRRQRVVTVPGSPTGAEADREQDDLTLESLDTPSGEQAVTGDGGVEPGGEQNRPQRVEVGVTDRRRNFGPGNNGWMKVEILHAQRTAVLQVISFGGDGSLGEKDLVEALQSQYGITSGIDGEMVARLAQQAAASPNRVIRGHFPIAAGIEPDPASMGRIVYTCFEDVPGGREALAFDDLRAAMEADSEADVVAAPIAARMVMPGEELAVFVPPEDGYPDSMDAGAEALLKAADHVLLIDNHYVSEILGYVWLGADEISVIPPVWVSPDRTVAQFVRCPQAGPDVMVTEDWLQQALACVGVTNGISAGGVQQAAQESASPGNVRSTVVARATAVGPGEEGSAYFPFRRAKTGVAGAQHADLPAQIEAAGVKEGDLVAEITPPREAVPAMDVCGRELPDETSASSTEGPESVTAGSNVRVEERGERQYLYAEIDGRVRLFRGELRVHPVTYVDYNVQTTLNVEAGVDVHIRGSVRRGGVITAGGCVVVEGVVEGGARLSVGEDVVVAKGIIGKETLVNARGNVSCSMVQNASVAASGDLEVVGHSINGRLRAGGRLEIKGDEGERSGTAVGGELVSGGGIQARQVTRGPAATTLEIGPDPGIAARLQKVDEGLQFCRSNVMRVFRTLGVQEVDATHFKELIERSPPEKRKPMVKMLTQLKGLAQTRRHTLQRRQALVEQQAGIYGRTQIRISGRVDSDVEVRIGDARLTLTNAVDGVIFGHTDDRIVMQAAEGTRPPGTKPTTA